MNLLDYASAHTCHCTICDLPERDEIDIAMRKGVSNSVVIKWLTQEKGLDVSVARSVRNHKDSHLK